MEALGGQLDYIDLEFLGRTGIIATAMLGGRGGLALVDPGPSTTLPVLRRALAARGYAVGDVRAILLTHIHLDHAGATGSLMDECPNAEVFVHERGTPHLVDPAKLLASAARLYGNDMERLWGEVRAVPEGRIRSIGERDRLSIVGQDVEVAWTPGHAWHHVSYFLPSTRVAFVGDTAGVCRPSGRLVLPPTPPPDIDLEAWRASTITILAWNPEVLFLTHFGPQRSPHAHFEDLWSRLTDWRGRVQALLDQPGTDEDRARAFADEVTVDIARTTSPDEARAYAQAARFDFSWAGLARYLRRTARITS